MKIQCENKSCKKDIYIIEQIVCSNCNHVQKKKLTIKPFIAGLTLSIMTGFVGYKTGNFVPERDSERYPVAIEFSIINACAWGDEKKISISYLTKKREICIKALSKTMKQVSYQDYKLNDGKFLAVFKENINN